MSDDVRGIICRAALQAARLAAAGEDVDAGHCIVLAFVPGNHGVFAAGVFSAEPDPDADGINLADADSIVNAILEHATKLAQATGADVTIMPVRTPPQNPTNQ